MDTVNESTTFVVTLTFTDEDGDAVTPTSGTYRIDDVDAGTEILDDTAFSPSASTHDITITAAQNAILDSTLKTEKHRMTVTWLYGGTKQGNEEYIFGVVNLAKIT